MIDGLWQVWSAGPPFENSLLNLAAFFGMSLVGPSISLYHFHDEEFAAFLLFSSLSTVLPRNGITQIDYESSAGSLKNMRFWGGGYEDLYVIKRFFTAHLVILLVNIPEILHQTHLHYHLCSRLHPSLNIPLILFSFSFHFPPCFSLHLLFSKPHHLLSFLLQTTQNTLRKVSATSGRAGFIGQGTFCFARLNWLGFLFGLMLDEY